MVRSVGRLDFKGKFRVLRAPLFLLGCHKSGSSLLRALLDGHPDLWVIPKEAHPYAASGCPVLYPLRHATGRPASERFELKTFRAFLEKESRESSLTSDQPSFEFDLETFDEAFPRCLTALGIPLLAYLQAFGEMCGLPPPEAHQILVEKSVEHISLLDSLRNDFPDARFLIILRDPAATLVAVRRARQRDHFPYLHPILAAINSAFNAAVELEIAPNAHILLYEDLVRNPEGKMRKVAEWLGIPYQESLCVPTHLGNAWTGNSSSKTPFSGLDSRPISTWENHITPLERWLLKKISPIPHDQFGYCKMDTASFPWSPQTGEGVSLYLRHRFAYPGKPQA